MSLGSTDLCVDLVQAWPVLWRFLPALLHQLDALTGALVRGHQWPAQRRGRCHLLDDLCSKSHGYLGSRGPEGLWEEFRGRAGEGDLGLRNVPRTFHPYLLHSWHAHSLAILLGLSQAVARGRVSDLGQES